MKFIFIVQLCMLLMLTGCASSPDSRDGVSTAANQTATESQATDDAWGSLRSDFKLDHYQYNSEVREQLAWFENHPQRTMTMLTNATPYLYYIYQQVQERHLPGEFALLPVIESAYNPKARSYAGAEGMWQLMPGTANVWGVKQNWWYDGRRDVFASTKAALNYLTYLGNFFNGNWYLALAAYNAGEGTVQQAIEKNARAGKNTDYWDLPLPHQTQTYVPELLALAIIINHPARYGFTLPPIQDDPYFSVINLDRQISLATAAKMAEMNPKELAALNPAYKHNKLDPHGHEELILPMNKATVFNQNFLKFQHSAGARKDFTVADTSSDSPSNYTVKKGDTLNNIARRYHTSVVALKEANNLSSNALRLKQRLIIPGKDEDNHEIATRHSKQTKLANKNKHSSHSNEIATTHYHVRKGDTLNSIARKYGTTASKLKRMNRLASDRLRLHQELQIS